MVIKRGTGRQALIDVTATLLASGEQVQVKEVAALAGVSHTLIYRHFPDGGKEEMVAEGYATLFRGLAETDIDDLFAIIDERGLDQTRIAEFLLTLLDRHRNDVRWLRIEALVESRHNPYLAERIEVVRKSLIRRFALRLQALTPPVPHDQALAISVLAQAIPLGITAVAGTGLSRPQRVELSLAWAVALISAVRSAQDCAGNS